MEIPVGNAHKSAQSNSSVLVISLSKNLRPIWFSFFTVHKLWTNKCSLKYEQQQTNSTEHHMIWNTKSVRMRAHLEWKPIFTSSISIYESTNCNSDAILCLKNGGVMSSDNRCRAKQSCSYSSMAIKSNAKTRQTRH